jgi:hypothetical protein
LVAQYIGAQVAAVGAHHLPTITTGIVTTTTETVIVAIVTGIVIIGIETVTAATIKGDTKKIKTKSILFWLLFRRVWGKESLKRMISLTGQKVKIISVQQAEMKDKVL